jgi:signal transduction histidine kinase
MAVDMDMFAAGVLHDIRNLESVIVAVCHLATELMDEDPLLHRDQILNDLTSLENRARKLGIYARDIIQMVRETQKKLELSSQTLEESLQWCLDVLGLGEKLHFSIPKPLVKIMADPQFLRLALMNIIANAVKYARPDEAPTVEITQTITPANTLAGARIVTRIRDNGIGINEPDLRRVFEPFSRGPRKNPTTPGHDGFGLGLAMVAKVVGSMGGRVWAERPTDGQPGTVLCIELPATSEHL